jgi:hypothetical protein
MQRKLSGHHLDCLADRTRGMPLSLIGVRDPVTQLRLPPHAAQDFLNRYLPDDNIVGPDHAWPHLTVVVLHKHAFDATALPGRGAELGRALRVPPGEAFGIAAEVDGQRFGVVTLNETDAGPRRVHVTWLRFFGGLIGNGAYRNQDEAAESSGYSPTRSACTDAGSAGWRMSSAASGRHDRDVGAGEGDDRRGRRRLTRTEEL